MKNLSLRLPDDLLARLDRLSQDRGEAKSDVIRTALEAFLTNDQPATGISCADLAGDLIGSVEGPSDLATNPKYMKGYGQ